MIYTIKRAIFTLFAMGLAACGGGVGPGESALIGSWAQVGPSEVNPNVRLSDIEITYDRDGTSDYKATMVMSAPGSEPQQFDLVADVNWVLEETVITRTLTSITASPISRSEETESLARSIEQAYLQTPPVNLIIQSLDATSLILLDPQTGETQTYQRSSD